MPKMPYIQFYPNDWVGDQVAGCSLAAQGLWLRMLFLMHGSAHYGYLEVNGSPMPPAAIARMCGATSAEYETLLSELDSVGVPSRTDEGIIFSRRMVRDEKRRKLNQRNGKRGGNPALTTVLRNSVNHPDIPPDNPLMKMKYDVEADLRGVGVGGGVPDAFSSEEFLASWLRWRAHLREKKVKTTSLATQNQWASCMEWGVERAIAALKHSVAGSYQGLYEPRTVASGPNRNGAAAHGQPRSSERVKSLLEST